MTYSINDLPRFSPWPARLLGLLSWKQIHRTLGELTREYENEKWGPLLEKARSMSDKITIEDVDGWFFADQPNSLCYTEGSYELLNPAKRHKFYLKLVESTLKSFLPAAALVELGAGYGSIILGMAQRLPFTKMLLMAGEFAPSGIELMKLLAHNQNIDLESGNADFTSTQITDLNIPADAIIYTSYATCVISKIDKSFVSRLASFNPKAVVHFEPVYEYCNTETMQCLMQRRYIEVNDYNTNLLEILRSAQDQGKIQIIKEKPMVFGINPLLVISILIWTPI